MQNTGTFNGDIAFWVILCFTLPITLAFFCRMLSYIIQIWPQKPMVQYVPVKVDRVVYRSVYKTRPKVVERAEKKGKKTPQKKQKVELFSDTSIGSDAVAALRSLGHTAKDAKSLVNSCGSKNRHATVQDVLRDCF
jgi:hypothetical protein